MTVFSLRTNNSKAQKSSNAFNYNNTYQEKGKLSAD